MIKIHGTNGTITFGSASDDNAIEMNPEVAVLKVKYNDSNFWKKLDEYCIKQAPEEWHTISANSTDKWSIADDKAFSDMMEVKYAPATLNKDLHWETGSIAISDWQSFDIIESSDKLEHKVDQEPVVSLIDVPVETLPQPKFQYHRDGD